VRALGPAYLQAGATPDELGDLYLDVVRGGLAAALPAAVLLAVLGPVAVLALLGPGWAPVGVLLPLLAPRLVAYGLGLSRGALLTALDRAYWQTGLLGVELLLLVVGLAPAAWLGGLPAVAGLVSGVALVTSLAGLVLARRRLALPARRLLAALGPPAAAAAAAGLVVLATTPARAALDPLPALIAGALPFLGTYALVLALLWARAAPADR